MANSLLPKFRPRPPWWGPDLQTLRNTLVPHSAEPLLNGARRLALPMRDSSGDVLSALLNEPGASDGRRANPLVVLIHGLAGSEDSAYMLSSTRYWLGRGHPVVRLNLRGAGPSRTTCGQQYHAGRSADLRDALGGLPEELRSRGLIPIGYSLGGNMLLKFVAESAGQFDILAAASISAPIDLAAASRRFLDLRNWIYHRHLLGNMKRECFGGALPVSAEERELIAACRSIYEFDDWIVAPRNGFRNAVHYYEENHARRFLAEIPVPTMLVHALDDPWIPKQSYTAYPWKQNPRLRPVLTPGGGHVGFHAGDDKTPYHDRCIGAFIDELMC